MKTVKMTNRELLGLLGCLNAIQKSELTFPAKVWYSLSRCRSKMASTSKAISESEKKLFETLGEDDKDNNRIIPAKNQAKFIEEQNSLLDTEIDVEVMKVSMDQLEAEMDSMKGVENFYLFFEFIVEEIPEVKLKKAK